MLFRTLRLFCRTAGAPAVAVAWLTLAALGACNSSKKTEQTTAAPTVASGTKSRPNVPVPPPAASTDPAAGTAAPAEEPKNPRIGVWLTEKKEMDFEVKPERLLQQFIREFNDGTVVDKVMVAPAQDGPRGKPTFYLVGMGQRNGQFRAMALPLEQSNDDGGLYLPPTANRYIAEGTNCVLCYFNFSRGKVTGANCSEESTGAMERNCEFKTVAGNALFRK